MWPYGAVVAGRVLSLQEVADELGVHYMTAYRYVRTGLLAGEKIGNGWQVTGEELERFRSGASAVDETDGLPTTGPLARGSRRRAPWSERLEARLLAGDQRGAWAVIEGALAAGAGLAEIHDEVIAPAMRRIGDKWAIGELEISAEHRASGIVLRLLGRLGQRFARRGRSRGAVAVGGPPGERHSMPVLMIADLLRADGWEVSDFGTDLPVEAFVEGVRGVPDLAAVGVSVTSPECLAATAELLAALRVAVPGVRLAVGGYAVKDAAHARRLGADEWAGSAQDFLDQLNAWPQAR